MAAQRGHVAERLDDLAVVVDDVLDADVVHRPVRRLKPGQDVALAVRGKLPKNVLRRGDGDMPLVGPAAE